MRSNEQKSAMRLRMKRERAFTLIETLVVMSLLAVMLMLAAPSFVTFQRNSELTSSANSFLAALSAARSEAMKRQLRTFVIPITGTNWASGWVVFVDVDGNITTASTIAMSGSDIEVLRQSALPATVAVVTSSAATGFADGSVSYAMFNGSGFMTLVNQSFPPGGAHALDFTNGSETRRIVANTTGRLRVCKPTDAGCTASSSL